MKKRCLLSGLFLVAVCLAVWSILPVTAKAAATVASGSCGESLNWELNSDGVLTISGTGEMTDYEWTTLNGELPPWDAYKASIRQVNIEEGVTAIGTSAFHEYTALERVYMPKSLLDIDDFAFYGCTALRKADLPANLEYIGYSVFQGCDALMEVCLPPKVWVCGSAFADCISLSSVTFPVYWTEIPDSMLSGCKNLKKIELHEGLKKIGRSSFSGTGITSVTFPKSLTVIDDYAFCASNLKTVEIPAHITSVGNLAFANCEQLISATIASANTELTGCTFTYCKALESVSLPEGLQKICYSMFDGCFSLTNITIPQSVTAIEYQAFMDCKNLKQIDIPAGVTKIDGNAFRGCTSITKLVLPNGLTALGDAMASNCTSLTEVKIPSGVTSIGRSAFSGCTALKEITLPDTVTSVGAYAFYECRGLVKVKLPDHLEKIYEQTFAFCLNLEDVNIPKNLKSIGEHAFKGVIFRELTLPEGLETIGDSAFYACMMECVYIPKTVTSIGARAFDCNDYMWHVLYGGTEAQWEQIDMGAQNYPIMRAYRHDNATGDEITDLDKMICKHCGAVCPHKWDEGVVKKAATCKEDGTMVFTCSSCKATKEETIEKLSEHTYDHGCDPDCNACGATRSTSHNWNSQVTKDATCKEKGTLTYTCGICGQQKTEDIPKLTEHSWNNGPVTKLATCAQEGVRTFTCTVCKETRKESIPKRDSHLYDDDCDSDCNDCGEKRKTEHQWMEQELREPTCKEEGLRVTACTICGKYEKESIPKTDVHTYEHDCDETCDVCGKTRSIQHRYAEQWSGDQQSHWHACEICGAEGELADHVPGPEATESSPQYCTVCGIVLKPALDHVHVWQTHLDYNGLTHWYGCDGCGERQDEADHVYDNACDATCNYCNYARMPAHVPGAEATDTQAQTCTDCGVVLKPATGVPETTTQLENTEATTIPEGTDAPFGTDAPSGTDAPNGTDTPNGTDIPTGTGEAGTPGVTGEAGTPGETEQNGGASGGNGAGEPGAKSGGWIWMILLAVLLAAGATGFVLWKKKTGKK